MRDALEDACYQNGLADDPTSGGLAGVRATIESAYIAGIAEPRDIEAEIEQAIEAVDTQNDRSPKRVDKPKYSVDRARQLLEDKAHLFLYEVLRYLDWRDKPQPKSSDKER